jgi:hypothetical protein
VRTVRKDDTFRVNDVLCATVKSFVWWGIDWAQYCGLWRRCHHVVGVEVGWCGAASFATCLLLPCTQQVMTRRVLSLTIINTTMQKFDDLDTFHSMVLMSS